jgi:membrane-anchored protein YejM (alkaline phosphatase superfamily)
LALGDKPLEETLTYLNENGHLNESVLIVMSDHGSRLDNIRGTPQGQLEDRMPFFYIVVPSWFKQKYPAAWRNLNDNSNRLTSPFDVHETLKNILDMRNLKDVKSSKLGNT